MGRNRGAASSPNDLTNVPKIDPDPELLVDHLIHEPSYEARWSDVFGSAGRIQEAIV